MKNNAVYWINQMIATPAHPGELWTSNLAGENANRIFGNLSNPASLDSNTKWIFWGNNGWRPGLGSIQGFSVLQ